MQAIAVQNTETVLVAPGNVPFIHILNNGAETIYVKYDGDTQNPLTVDNGRPIGAGDNLHLDNDGAKPLFIFGVTAICAAGPCEARVQGA